MIIGLYDINFFNVNSTNNVDAWKAISNLVRGFFKVFLYLAAGATLTLLIYMSVVLVLSSFTGKGIKMPLGSTFRGGKGKDPRKEAGEKRFIEQWFSSVLILTLMVYIINLIVAFSNVITDISNTYHPSEEEGNSIIIYVKNSKVDHSTIDYYFKTDIEGLLMFQTQYNSDEYFGRNMMNFFCGLIITIFKYCLSGLFIIRTFIVAFLSAIAPVIVLINAFMKIGENQKIDILKKWFLLYLYFVFLRPAIAIIYFILAKSNVYLVNQFPLYILLVIAVIIALVILSIRKLFKAFGENKQKKA